MVGAATRIDTDGHKSGTGNLPRRWLTVGEAARYIGFQPRTLYAWISQRKGPAFVKVGRLVKFDLHDLDSYLESRKVYPREEPDVRSPLERGAVRVVPGGIFSS